MNEKQESKRDFLKKSVYVVPAILTLKAIPAFAGSGSGQVETGNSREGNGARSEPGNTEKKFKKFKFGRKNRA
jgi:hypothetical protein